MARKHFELKIAGALVALLTDQSLEKETELANGHKVKAEDVTLHAFQESGLDADAWNAQTDETCAARIAASLEALDTIANGTPKAKDFKKALARLLKQGGNDQANTGGNGGGKKVKALRIHSKAKSFRRAGLAFTTTERVIAVSKLKKDQVEALLAESELVVVEDSVDEKEITG